MVDHVLAGDAQAFEELVQRHEQRVYRVTMAITGNHEDAEEAMQETFLTRILQQAVRGVLSVGGFMC